MSINRLNRLRGSQIYTAGPIDFCEHSGVEWRNSIKPHLKAMNIIVLDPCQKPTDRGHEIGKEKQNLITLKEEGKWEDLHLAMKDICHIDLRCVQKSDAVIFYLPDNIKMTGTIYELAIAVFNKIPTLIFCPNGKASVANWIHGIVSHKYMFDTEEELLCYLRSINDGTAEDVDMKKWAFFDAELLYGGIDLV